MPKKSITDKEIGLIKRMLARGMRNKDIQFYFNRQDRAVNSGRITGIKNETYGPEVPTATEEELEAFLLTFTPADVGAVLGAGVAPKLTLAEEARSKFVKVDKGWRLIDGETTDQECKREFNPKKLASVIASIAALSNNRGGFVFLGVDDQTCEVIGLPSDEFSLTDIVRITDKAKTLLVPTPIFSKLEIRLDDLVVGVFHVERHPKRPIIVCKDEEKIQDGSILFRYPGQSSRIKFGDLLELLAERDRAVQAELLTTASKVADIGVDRALVLDTARGQLSNGVRQITIDRELAEKLEFIREGAFEEREGAPTLRLVGDVRAVTEDRAFVDRVEDHALVADDAIAAYLNGEVVRSPLEYVCLSALVQRQWLPLHYFVRLAAQGLDAAIQALSAKKAVYKQSKIKALQRLQGQLSAYNEHGGPVRNVINSIRERRFDELTPQFTASQIARGIQGLPDEQYAEEELLDLVQKLYQSAENSNEKSQVVRAIARLDELGIARALKP